MAPALLSSGWGAQAGLYKIGGFKAAAAEGPGFEEHARFLTRAWQKPICSGAYAGIEGEEKKETI